MMDEIIWGLSIDGGGLRTSPGAHLVFRGQESGKKPPKESRRLQNRDNAEF